MKYAFYLLAGAVSSFFFISPAFADQSDFVSRLKTCKEVSSIVQRAQCFDTALDDYDLTTLKRNDAVNQDGGWKLSIQKSTLTDNINVTLTVTATDRFTTKDTIQARPSLVLACIESKPNAYISWGAQLDVLDNTIRKPDNTVNSRMGAEPVIAQNWNISTDKTASFIPDPIGFYKKMMNPSGLYVVKIWPHAYYDTVTATFDVKGLAEKFKALKDACKLP